MCLYKKKYFYNIKELPEKVSPATFEHFTINKDGKHFVYQSGIQNPDVITNKYIFAIYK